MHADNTVSIPGVRKEDTGEISQREAYPNPSTPPGVDCG